MISDNNMAQALNAALAETPEHRLGMSIHQAFTALDEIMALAADPETRALVKKDQIMLGQLVTRARILGGLVNPREEAGQLKMVVNRP